MKTTDRRIIRTKNAVQSALLELLAEKPLSDITVTELAQTADINRKTFYNYYSDVSMVLEEIENQIVDDFRTALKDIQLMHLIEDPSEVFLTLTGLISADADLYDRILAADSMNSLLAKVVSALKSYLMEALRGQVSMDMDRFDYVIEYALSGMVAVYRQWFLSGRKGDLSALSRNVSILTFRGIAGLAEEMGFMDRDNRSGDN